MPNSIPVGISSVRPAGAAPAVTDQLYGGVPPAAVNVCEYGLPVPPAGSAVDVMESVPATVKLICFDALLEFASVTCTVNPKVPLEVAVPLIWPELLKVSPPGREPSEIVQVYGADPPAG